MSYLIQTSDLRETTCEFPHVHTGHEALGLLRSRMLRRIAFLTLSQPEGFFIYDKLTFPALKKLGFEAVEIPWDTPNVDWSKYAAVVIRSTWDYQNRLEEFLDVLRTISDSGTPLMNDLETVRWNIHKSYLTDLQRKGVPIVPTLWRTRLTSLDSLFDELKTNEIVVKPAIGANADATFRLSRTCDSASTLAAFADRECMIQPFLPSIVTEGEYSLFYFAHEFSHAIVKRPASGDFRVQEEHGGVIEAFNPSKEIRDQGERVICALPHRTLYARVDLVMLPSSEWAVMEVELIEPSLYFPYDEASSQRFAQALLRFVSK